MEKLDAGATLLQLYTGFIYEGPSLVKRINKAILKEMKIIECPRDAMQGISEFIATDIKAAYINQLLKVGFDTIDFGSFVSPKAISHN